MSEILLNLHMHTTYSDGSGSHSTIAAAAMQSGLDAVIVTDHNVLVKGVEGYRQDGQRRLMLFIGEE
ncbi:MAG: PHP domain-containing protein, partial [Anaerolineae bacterium]|nr:PHP domain-containing protein [Anaerolineae bacterium]